MTLTRLRAEPLEGRAVPAAFAVTTTADAGTGSLRDAILQANASPGGDLITFNIPTTDPGFVDPGANGRFDDGDYWSIAPASALPAITRGAFLDGWTQPGPSARTRPVIELNGANAGAGVDGLVLTGHTGSTVRGFAVNRFGGNGIVAQGGGGHRFTGDFLGTDPSGTADRGNTLAGLVLADSASNNVGGVAANERNLISGNDLQGVRIAGAGAVNNHVFNCLVGTVLNGDAALANGTAVDAGDGIRIEGGRFNIIGGRAAGTRNVLSGNFDDGLDIRDGASSNLVLNNAVGTGPGAGRVVGNGADGVYLQDASFNYIGGTLAGDANVFSGNGFNGVFLFGDSHDNAILGNFIGTTPRGATGFGNGTAADFADGVFLARFDAPVGPADNFIFRNVIAYNRDSAVAMDTATTANFAGNRLQANAIFGNRGRAIDLASDGATPNDPGDPDLGPNRLQNFPVLLPPTANADRTRTVTGTLNSTPGSRFRIEFFASAAQGEGAVLLGAAVTTAGADGNSPVFQLRYAAPSGRPFVTATATNLATGDTSEFSAAVRDPQALRGKAAGPGV